MSRQGNERMNVDISNDSSTDEAGASDDSLAAPALLGNPEPGRRGRPPGRQVRAGRPPTNPENRIQPAEGRNEYMRRYMRDYRSSESDDQRDQRLEENRQRHSARREDDSQRASENARDLERRHRLDQTPGHREGRRRRDRQSHELRRASPTRRAAERAANTEQRRQARIAGVRLATFRDMNLMMLTTCGCCLTVPFEDRIRNYTATALIGRENIAGPLVNRFCLRRHPDQSVEVCNRCKGLMKNGQAPKLCAARVIFPTVDPDVARLSVLEEIMVAPIILFMKIRPLGVDRQVGLRGSVICVPLDINDSLNAIGPIPRNFNETFTIQVRFMRRMEYQEPHLFRTINPQRVMRAARILRGTPLYENVPFNEDWVNQHPEEGDEDFIVRDQDRQEVQANAPARVQAQAGANQPEEEDEDDDPEPVNPGALETLLVNPNLQIENPAHQNAAGQIANEERRPIQYAPGEGHRPISLLSDPDILYKAFPTLFGGRRIEFPDGEPSFSQVAKYLALHENRLLSRPEVLFTILMKIHLHKLRASTSIALRQHYVGNNRVTAGQLRGGGGFNQNVDGLVRNDDAYRFLAPIQNSPAYWAQRKKEVMAMVRQLGCPTFFLTLSAAESKWTNLQRSLKSLADKRPCSERRANGLRYQQRAKLIQEDPITCARFFHNRVSKLFAYLRKPHSTFAPNIVEDSYRRDEFQQRGSAHAHSLLWNKDAPQYNPMDPSSLTACISFIDKHITCYGGTDMLVRVEGITPELALELIEYQRHQHRRTCNRIVHGENICRFDFPRFPMHETKILQPLSEGEKTEEVRRHLASIRRFLGDAWRNRTQLPENFGVFLNLLPGRMTPTQYYQAIRCSLSSVKVFLKRRPCDFAINNYNIDILTLHQANMDIQFVLNPYSCAQYILNYINKANRGMSRLLREVVEEARRGNQTVQEITRLVGNKFISCSEISAQEAAYHILQLAVSMSSRKVIFINTFAKENRVRILRPRAEIQNLEEDDPNIFTMNLLDHYANRPDSMEHLTLAEVAANYEYIRQRQGRGQREERAGDDQNNEDDDENEFNALIDEIVRENPNAEVVIHEGDEDNVDYPEDAFAEAFEAAIEEEVAQMNVDQANAPNNQGNQGIESDNDEMPMEVSGGEENAAAIPGPVNRRNVNFPKRPEQLQLRAPDVGRFRWRRKAKVIRYRKYNRQQDEHNFLREQLMLFFPWRDEDIELNNLSHDDLIVKYNQNVELIQQVKHEFAPEDTEDLLEQAIEEIFQLEMNNDDDENANRDVRPREEDEAGLEDEFALRQPRASHENVDFFEQIGGPRPAQPSRAVERNVQRVHRRLGDYSVLLGKVSRLNEAQNRLLLECVRRVRLGIPFHLFIAGGAGVGKSYFIETLNLALDILYNGREGADGLQLKVLLCAPTGKAAFNIHGLTLHGAFSLPFTQTPGEMIQLSASEINTIRTELYHVEVIIIDEISMVGRKQLQNVDVRLQQIFTNNLPFGGKSVIVLGDFHQLQPVGDSFVFAMPRQGPAILAGNPLWELFRFAELTEIMRQRDDVPFARALNNMAVGQMTAQDIALLRSRQVYSNNGVQQLQIPNETIRLFQTNRWVDHLNNQILDQRTPANVEDRIPDCPAEDRARNGTPEAHNDLNALLPSKKYGLSNVLKLRLGVRYSVTLNLNTADGIVNGAWGTLRHVSFKIGNNRVRQPDVLWIEFPAVLGQDGVGSATRQRYLEQMRRENLPNNYTPIVKETREMPRCRGVKYMRTQFPIKPAEASTIHKSQGSTYERVVVKSFPPLTPQQRRQAQQRQDGLPENEWPLSRQMLYVACSRATSINGLFFDGPFNPPTRSNPPTASDRQDEAVDREMLRLRGVPLQFTVPSWRHEDQPELPLVPEGAFKIVCHNVENLNTHFALTLSDHVIKGANLVLLSETWSFERDIFPFHEAGFMEVPGSRINGGDGRARRPGTGSLAAAKLGQQATITATNEVIDTRRSREATTTSHIELVTVKVEMESMPDLQIVSLYSSPRVPIQELLETLRDRVRWNRQGHLLILGDFNVNLRDRTDHRTDQLLQFMRERQMTSLLDDNAITTTGHANQIDLVFSRLPTARARASVYETAAHITHKPLLVSIW